MAMNLGMIIPLALRTSIFLTVFALGLKADPRDATTLLRTPGLLGRSLFSMYVVMPVVAAALAGAFGLHPAVKIALVALAVSPVPPVLPKKALKAGGEPSDIIGLLVAAAVLAIVIVPVALALLAWAFGTPVHMASGAVASLVLITVLMPLVAGMALRRVAPGSAERGAAPIAALATVRLVARALPLLLAAWRPVVSLIGNGTIVAFVAFIAAGLAAGHVLGGPEPERRTVLALSTASRHPGVAIAIATASFPGQTLILAAIVSYLLLNAMVTIAYLTWSRRQRASLQTSDSDAEAAAAARRRRRA
jgi:BASS family bile acid:Na+ symporter